ncbi:hypothetical protein J4727_20410 [Providencia rettgeri]|uniref:Uncharacterized protein n=1 Tax=Providencia rettgeri TaxID=587 RepID=A0A939NIC5_PRORE|nr:hypothetical protein [Providencia rettgeri]
MPLIFWTKMNDIRLPSGYFLRLDACEKPFTQARSSPPFSPLYLVAQKCGGQTLRLTGLCPKTKHVHWGSLAIAGACHFVSAPPVFLRSHQDKAYRPRFTRLVKSLLATKQVCDFQRFRIVLLVSLHDVKNALRSPQNRSKLSA